jgi:hypothetical protein
MAKYFLNIRQSGRSDDMEENIIYRFDLETPLRFPFYYNKEKPTWHSYNYLEIKSQKAESEFFHNVESKGVIGGKFSPVTNY